MCNHKWVLIAETLENPNEINSGIDFEAIIIEYFYCVVCGITTFHERYGFFYNENPESDTD